MDRVEIKHSQTKAAWNIIGTTAGMLYKYARIPYQLTNTEEYDARNRKAAYELATKIARFLNTDYNKENT